MRKKFDTSNYVGTWEMMMHASIDADEAKELMALSGVLGQLGVRGSLFVLNPFEYH
jgi:hypothetical protein